MHNNELDPRGKLKLRARRLQNFAIYCNDFLMQIALQAALVTGDL